MASDNDGDRFSIPYQYLEAYPYPAFVLIAPIPRTDSPSNVAGSTASSSSDIPFTRSSGSSQRPFDVLWSNSKWDELVQDTSLLHCLDMAGRREFGDWISGAREDRAKIKRGLNQDLTGSTSFGLATNSMKIRHPQNAVPSQAHVAHQVVLNAHSDTEKMTDNIRVDGRHRKIPSAGHSTDRELPGAHTLTVNLSTPIPVALELTKTILIAPQRRLGPSDLPSQSHSLIVITSIPRSAFVPSALPQGTVPYISTTRLEAAPRNENLIIPDKSVDTRLSPESAIDSDSAGPSNGSQSPGQIQEQVSVASELESLGVQSADSAGPDMPTTVHSSSQLAVNRLIGSTDVHALYDSFDWSKTPLGPRETWPCSLKTMVSVMFAYPTPACIWWGRELTLIYNRANAKTIDKHPEIFGASGPVAWAEVWDSLGPLAEMALNGTPVWKEDDFLLLDAGETHGNRSYECYHSWMWVPIIQEDGTVGGLWNAITETTKKVLLERRLATIRDLAEQTSTAKSQEEFDTALIDSLSANPKDVPFFAMYHLEQASDHGSDSSKAKPSTSPETKQLLFHRTASTGIPITDTAIPSSFSTTSGDLAVPSGPNLTVSTESNITNGSSSSHSPSSTASPVSSRSDSPDPVTWPIQQAVQTRKPVLVHDCRDLISTFEIRVWDELPREAMVIPIANEYEQPVAIFIVGLNIRRPFEQDYADFILASSLTAVRVAEAERRQMDDMEALDRAKNLLFSNISHEFRTPLTLIAGPIEDLIAVTADKKHRNLLKLAQNNARRLNRLVSSLMDLSRLKAGKLSCEFKAVNLGEFTRDLASMFTSVAHKARLEYNIECDLAQQLVFVDPEQWEKIVLNLISNAFKYTMRGTVTVSLSYQDGRAVLNVADTGVGIPSSDQGRIGERFHRVVTTSRSHEGVGIGLSLVKELIRLHGGTLTLTSVTTQESLDDSHGSTFTVSLPIGQDHLPQGAIHSEPVSHNLSTNAYDTVLETQRWTYDQTSDISTPDTDTTSEVDSISSSPSAARRMQPEARYFRRDDVIMIVDDSYETRKYIQSVFTPYCTVVGARDGQEALEMCAESQPDLLITDVMMPRVDGFELLDKLKSSMDLKDIPVIMCTARGGDESKIEGLMSGADDYLEKPFSAKELIARAHVQILLGKNRKRLQKAFELQTQELRALTDNSPVGLFRISDAGEITFVNSYWYDLSSYPRDKSLDGWLDCIVEEHRERATVFWKHMFLVTEKDIESLELQFTNGRWVTVKIIRLDLVSASLKGLLGCVTDITDRIQQQEAQKRRLEEVEQRRLEAEEAKRQQELLIDITSHEIRNPISSFMQITLKEQLEGALDRQKGFTPTRQLLSNIEDDLEALESIYQCGLGQERICNDVLSLGRIQLELFDVETSVRQQVQKVVSVFRSEARMNRISLSSKMGPNAAKLGVDMIKTDPVRLGQVMTNLLSNGIRFTSNSELRQIEISYDLTLDPPEQSKCVPPGDPATPLDLSTEQDIYLYISVSDTGPGMTTEELEKLFHRFSQVSPKTHAIFGGSGLGLFVCRLGGRIDVVSDHGKGSTFRFFIKARTCRPAPTPKSTERRHSVGRAPNKIKPPPMTKRHTMNILSSGTITVPGSNRKPNVLIVEDNLINQTVLARQLKHVGFQCQVANNGLEALKKIRKVSALDGSAEGQPFDCVLMDLEMPIMDGLTAVRTIREQESSGQLARNAVVALTGNARQGQIDEAKAAGMDDVVIKPYRLDDLLSKIESMMALRRMPSASVHEPTSESSP
ncbi:hypothetical protein IAU59_002164 [Kwoniella sp. CBS 9459]